MRVYLNIGTLCHFLVNLQKKSRKFDDTMHLRHKFLTTSMLSDVNVKLVSLVCYLSGCVLLDFVLHYTPYISQINIKENLKLFTIITIYVYFSEIK